MNMNPYRLGKREPINEQQLINRGYIKDSDGTLMSTTSPTNSGQ